MASRPLSEQDEAERLKVGREARLPSGGGQRRSGATERQHSSPRAADRDGACVSSPRSPLERANVPRWRDREGFEGENEKTDARIVLRSLEEPLRQIAQNAGLEGAVVVNDVRKR